MVSLYIRFPESSMYIVLGQSLTWIDKDIGIHAAS